MNFTNHIHLGYPNCEGFVSEYFRTVLRDPSFLSKRVQDLPTEAPKRRFPTTNHLPQPKLGVKTREGQKCLILFFLQI